MTVHVLIKFQNIKAAFWVIFTKSPTQKCIGCLTFATIYSRLVIKIYSKIISFWHVSTKNIYRMTRWLWIFLFIKILLPNLFAKSEHQGIHNLATTDLPRNYVQLNVIPSLDVWLLIGLPPQVRIHVDSMISNLMHPPILIEANQIVNFASVLVSKILFLSSPGSTRGVPCPCIQQANATLRKV